MEVVLCDRPVYKYRMTAAPENGSVTLDQDEPVSKDTKQVQLLI